MADRRLEITIRRRDDANVDANRLRAPDSLEFPLLQDPQKRDLRLGQQFTHFVQENRAAIGQFETPEPPLRGSGERALLMAEQF